jgi:benzoyl-CoA reductase/2-hydroxyglutaryl-CoA dehydratase subunit BcrC/BadD/HgdB
VEEKADFVTDILCTGTRWFAEDVPDEGERGNDEVEERECDPLARLARFYFGRDCMCRRPNRALYDYARQLTARFRVQGLVYKTLLYCDPYSFEVKRLQQALGIPVLHLDTDYSSENREQVRTRVEAFVETL